MLVVSNNDSNKQTEEDKENASFDTSLSEILPKATGTHNEKKGTPLKTLYERPEMADDEMDFGAAGGDDMVGMDDDDVEGQEEEEPAVSKRQSMAARRVSFHQSTKMGSDDLDEVRGCIRLL